MSSKNSKIRVGISCGDPNGIGLEALADAFRDERTLASIVPVVFAPRALAERAFENIAWGEVSDASEARQAKSTCSTSTRPSSRTSQVKRPSKPVPWPWKAFSARWATWPKPPWTCL